MSERPTDWERGTGPDEAGVPDLPSDAIDRGLDALFGEDEMEAPRGPGIELDKTGALAGVPKLEPRHPYDRPERPIGHVPPKPGDAGPSSPARDDMASIPGGRFLAGEAGQVAEVPAFEIDSHPVTHEDYLAFVVATGHRPPLYWPDGRMPGELADHPVVGVDYFDALAFARWKGKDLPFEDEWERAARSTDGRVFPWGNETEPTEANTARLGLKTTTPVGWYAMNRTPEGVVDLIGNVWEITHSPAKGGGIALRGGSWFDFALYAKGWFAFASPPEARNGTIGFRCVRRPAARADVPRAVAPGLVDPETAKRCRPQPSVDPTTFSPEKRDLVPDYRRLRNMREERAREEGIMGEPASRVPVKAAVPPPLSRRPPRPSPGAPADEGPIHVTDVPPVRPASPVPASPAPAAPPPAARPPAATHPTPEALDDASGRWLFGAAVLLGAVLLGLLVAGLLADREEASRDGPSPELVATATEPSFLLPDPPEGDARDAADLVWLGSGTDLAALDRGAWLLVFTEVSSEDGAQTTAALSALHRALRDADLEVALVVPSEALAEGFPAELLPEARRQALLRRIGARGDLTVVLDPYVGPPLGGALRKRWAVDAPHAALLVRDGHLRGRTTPTAGGFTRSVLERLALLGLDDAGEDRPGRPR